MHLSTASVYGQELNRIYGQLETPVLTHAAIFGSNITSDAAIELCRCAALETMSESGTSASIHCVLLNLQAHTTD